MNNYNGNECDIEVDTSGALVYTKYQAFIIKKYFSNPIGNINITQKGNDSLLVKIHLEYQDELELQGEFIALKDNQKSKFY